MTSQLDYSENHGRSNPVPHIVLGLTFSLIFLVWAFGWQCAFLAAFGILTFSLLFLGCVAFGHGFTAQPVRETAGSMAARRSAPTHV
jgi:hypothetical protein